MQEKEDICIYVEDDQRPAWLASSWPIVFTGQRCQTRNSDAGVEAESDEIGFHKRLLQRQIGDSSHGKQASQMT
jgi:hypothetical protein